MALAYELLHHARILLKSPAGVKAIFAVAEFAGIRTFRNAIRNTREFGYGRDRCWLADLLNYRGKNFFRSEDRIHESTSFA
jgi:hypothetical protein